MKITFIGLGKMGSAIAHRLLQANFDLTVYNRTPEKMQAFVELGAKAATSPRQAVAGADIVLTCLLNDSALMEVVTGAEGFLPALRKNQIHIGTSTILPATSKTLTQLHQQNGSIYIAANVLGVPKAAARGELTSLVAGDSNYIDKCTAIFNAYSNKIIQVGNEAYQANVMKICINYLLVSTIEALSEIYTFAEKSALDLNIVNTFFHTVFAHPAFKLYVDKIKQRNFDEVNFDLNGGYKDINLFLQSFAEAGTVPGIASVIKNKFITALAYDMGQQDWSAIYEIIRLEAGLK